MAEANQWTRDQLTAIGQRLGQALGQAIIDDMHLLTVQLERKSQLSEVEAARWRALFSRVSKRNVLEPLLKDRMKKIIERRISIVEAVEKNDGRMMRAQVDLLRDLLDDVDREWDW